MINGIKDRIVIPFGEMLWFFLSIWLFTSAADTFFWSIHGNPVFGAYMASHGLLMSYIIVLLCSLLKGIVRSILEAILIFLGIINLILDTIVHNIMHFSFTKDMVAIILGSNVSEAREFLPMYFDKTVILFLLSSLFLFAIIFAFRKPLSTLLPKTIKYVLLSIVVLTSIVIAIRKSNNWEGVFLYKIVTFLSYETPVDLGQYRSCPEIDIAGEQPDNIIMIIGESLSRNHCSVYGYDKPTQPLLGEMLDDSLIIALTNAEAAFPNTSESFKQIMSTYDGTNNPDSWFSDNVFLMDIMKAAGYSTYWVSNQSSTGLYDNIVAKFAALADTTIWLGTKGMGIGKCDYDEIVIPVIQELSIRYEKKFIVIHLMGSHEGFNMRYPDSFAKFSESDYSDYPENQRYQRAAYDNSVSYNDFVVSELMHIFDASNSIVFYFPDHGLDIYDTDPNYVGHARTIDSTSFQAGISIPLIVYPATGLKEKERIMAFLKSNGMQHFSTGNSIEMITHFANIRIKTTE